KAGNRDDGLHALEVGSDEDLAAAGIGDPDFSHPGMGKWRTHEGDILHAGEPDVTDKLAATAKEAVILLAKQRGAHTLYSHINPPPAPPGKGLHQHRRCMDAAGARSRAPASPPYHLILPIIARLI